jgi:hypothetical protein
MLLCSANYILTGERDGTTLTDQRGLEAPGERLLIAGVTHLRLITENGKMGIHK